MIDLEAEIFIAIKAWKNFDELEESICLPELDFLLKSLREQTREEKIFLASLQGIDLRKNIGDPVEEKRREIERRAAERLAGGAEALERQELMDFGIEVIVDD